MADKVLILCPHNAAKSVASAALLRREAAGRGRKLEIVTAGTDPDDEVLGLVADFLAAEDLPPAGTPRHVTADDLATADLVINIGCDHAELPTRSDPGGGPEIRDWDVPDFSSDPDAAFADIVRRVNALADELS